jgi:hypothetical protein
MNRPALIIVPLNCGNYVGSIVFDDGEVIAWPEPPTSNRDALIEDFGVHMSDTGRCS